MTELSKDRLFGFRNTIVDKDSKQRDRLTIYLNQEDIQDMINILTENLTSEAGVKFTLHTGTKTNTATGHDFLSTFGFVKAVQAQAGGFAGAGGGNRKAVPKTSSRAAAIADNVGKTVA